MILKSLNRLFRVITFIFFAGASSILMATVDSEEAFLEKLIEKNTEVRSAYEACSESSRVPRRNVMSCVWGDGVFLDDNDNEISPIAQGTREEIMEALEFVRENEERQTYKGVDLQDGLSTDVLENTQLPDGENIRNSDARAIRNFFGERLQKALFGIGDESGERKYVSDHGQFYELYRNQLSKNVIEAISSYCIEAVPIHREPSGQYFTYVRPKSSELRKKIRDHYINKLMHEEYAPKENDQRDHDTVIAYDHWTKCSQRIQPTCENRFLLATGSDFNDEFDLESYTNSSNHYVTGDPDAEEQLRVTTNTEFYCSGENYRIHEDFRGIDTEIDNLKIDCEDQEYIVETQQRSCGIARYIDSSRRNIAGLDRIDKRFEEFSDEFCANDNCGRLSNLEGDNYDFFNPSREDGTDIDSLTTMTSADVINEDYKASVENMQEAIDRCIERRDEEACRHFVFDNNEEALQDIDEYEIRSRAMKEKIDKIDHEDEDELRRYLKEEGFSENEIQRMINDPEQAKELISHRYDSMRENLIDELRREAEQKTIEGNINFDDDDDMAKLRRIQDEIEHQVDQRRDITHFNNVVSSYLQLHSDNQNDGPSRNTASLYAEIDRMDEHFSESQDKLEDAAQKAEPHSASDDTSSTRLEAETINEAFLGY